MQVCAEEAHLPGHYIVSLFFDLICTDILISDFSTLIYFSKTWIYIQAWFIALYACINLYAFLYVLYPTLTDGSGDPDDCVVGHES